MKYNDCVMAMYHYSPTYGDICRFVTTWRSTNPQG